MREEIGTLMGEYETRMARINHFHIMENIEKLIEESRKGIISQDEMNYEKNFPEIAYGKSFGWDGGATYNRRIVKSMSLLGGASYKTQRMGRYEKYQVPDIGLKLNKGDGKEFKASEIGNMSDMELNVLFEAATAQVNLEMERISKEYGDHVKGQQERMIAELTKFEGERLAGEAALELGFMDMPLTEDFPLNLASMAKIGAAIAVACIPGVGLAKSTRFLNKTVR